MAIPGLKNIPSEYRDLYEHTYEILQRLRDRQAELTVLMQDEKDSVKRAKFSKERTNINRWLGDVTQAPETFTGIELSKYTNKQLGQRVHTVARSLMDKFNIDPRKASAGGSTQHHIDPILQTYGAYEGASIDTIFQINQSLKDEEIYLGTDAQGRNFYDVDATTHPEFHRLSPEDKVDYTNKVAKLNEMPTGTAAERAAAVAESVAISRQMGERAAALPQYQKRIEVLSEVAESQEPGLGQTTKELFLPGPKKLEDVSRVRTALKSNPEFMSGGVKMYGGVPFAQQIYDTIKRNPFGAGVGALTAVDPEAIKLARKGQYTAAAVQTGAGAVLGGLVEQGLKRVAPVAMKLMPQAGKMVMGTVGAPIGAGMVGYQALDVITTAATGKTLQETGQAAEQTKEELRQQGMSEYQLRRRARTGR
jgi:hypothetical protein